MTDRYAVLGHPIAHSQSPRIHAEFARATGDDLEYTAVLAPLDGFEATVRDFIAAGGRGVNVTVPFKQQAYALADERTPNARRARAANVLDFRDGRIVAHNTDGVGLIRDLVVNLKCPLAGRRVLLLGAGGASWGVAGPLLDAAPARLAVANRTPQKAQDLAAHFPPGRIEAFSYEALAGEVFDIIINGTSAGLTDAMPPLPATVFARDALAYDMVYGKVTPFMAFSRAQGACVADGLGMLVEQAAESFFIWRGVRPETAPVIALLRSAVRSEG